MAWTTMNKIINNQGETMSDTKEKTYLPPEELEKIKQILIEIGCWKEDEDKDSTEVENVKEGD